MPRPFTQMTTKELAEATAEFDREFVVDSFGAVPTELVPVWERALGDAQSVAEDQAITVVRVGLETKLLAESDRMAHEKGISRADLIARGLEAVLAAEG